MTIRLTWNRVDNEEEQGETLVSLPFTIGRAEENDLVIGEFGSGISRFHACIREERGLPLLQDCGSTNGIYVNRNRIYQISLLADTPFLMGNYLFNMEWVVQCQKESCQRLISHQEKTCPWCGQFLADAVTSLAPFLQ